jgi:hypothetical protein
MHLFNMPTQALRHLLQSPRNSTDPMSDTRTFPPWKPRLHVVGTTSSAVTGASIRAPSSSFLASQDRRIKRPVCKDSEINLLTSDSCQRRTYIP